MIIDLIKKAEETHSLEKKELIAILGDNSINSELFQAADRVRKKYVGDEVHLRGLLEYSNICKQNCLYCGIRRDNKKVERYRLSVDEVVGFAENAVSFGLKTIVIQSGEGSSGFIDDLVYVVQKIKSFGVAITLSIGEFSEEEYRRLKNAGADRFLLRIETTDPKLYKKMHPGMSLQNRKKCLKNLKKLGYETGSGCLVGLPGQSIDSLADDILFFKELNADMIGIGPFVPSEDTPLSGSSNDNFELSLKVMALTRLLLPDINIPATTAMEALDPQGRLIALQSGANVVMPNVTEGEYRKKYELYPGKVSVSDTPQRCRDSITIRIKDIGRSVSNDFGFRHNKDGEARSKSLKNMDKN